jgi:hypothetical protein
MKDAKGHALILAAHALSASSSTNNSISGRSSRRAHGRGDRQGRSTYRKSSLALASPPNGYGRPSSHPEATRQGSTRRQPTRR